MTQYNPLALLGCECILSGSDTGTRATSTEAPSAYDKDKGYSWGSCLVWFKCAEPTEKGLKTYNAALKAMEAGVGEDAGDALVGVPCYAWDNTLEYPRVGVIAKFEVALPYPYYVGICPYNHARPCYMGPPAGVGERTDVSIRRPSGNALSDMARMFAEVSMTEGRWHSRAQATSTDTPEPEAKKAATPKLTWDAVKGQDEAKQALREAVELPRKFGELYAAYGKRPSKGALLYGPTGCGKTMLGRAMAHTLDCGAAGFRYVKGGELFDKHVGSEEKQIREMFANARHYKSRTGNPMILFFDEADALFPMRREMGESSHAGYDFMASTAAAFLTELDGLEDSAAFVILSTNRPEVIDTAVLREGRIDRKVRIARPTQEVAQDIANHRLANVPKATEVDLAALIVAEIWNPKLVHYVIGTEDSGDVRICYHHQVSGAMVDGICERAVNNALQRDIALGNAAPTGVTEDDVKLAVTSAFQATKDLRMAGVIQEVLGSRKATTARTFHGPHIAIAGKEKHEITVKREVGGHGEEF